MSKIEVRGHSRFERRAPMLLRILAGVFDVALGVLLLEIMYAIFALDPLVDWKLALGLGVNILAPWLLGRWIAGRSLGEWIWRIRSEKVQAREKSDEIRGCFWTFSAIALCCVVFLTSIRKHPYWSNHVPVSIAVVVPPSEWRVLSFFYTLAPWPVELHGRPIFYSLPYELGPPKRFVGHIEANWITDSVRVEFEGPKTPQEYQSRVRNRSAVRRCFSKSPIFDFECIDVRRLTLERHLAELRALGYAKFEARWFSAENPAISENEQAQGVLLRAQAGKKIQERYILITPQGIHQSISLSYLRNAEGEDARKEFEKALGALRISEDLAPGRAWVDRLLESSRLDQLPPMSDPTFLNGLASIQSLLISKLSVDPGAFDAYYHLAGSNLLLLKYCMKNPHPELKSLAQAMIERMDHFAHDVAGDTGGRNPKLSELDRIFQDSKQF